MENTLFKSEKVSSKMCTEFAFGICISISSFQEYCMKTKRLIAKKKNKLVG